MATIHRFPWLRHLKSEPSFHVLRYRRGALVRSGRGLDFWFQPLNTTVAEVPCDDREEAFVIRGRSSDCQELTVQGVIAWRVVDPEVLANRIDFSIDVHSGRWRKAPLEKVTQALSAAAGQHARDHVASRSLRELSLEGTAPVRDEISNGLSGDPALADLGIEVVAVRVAAVQPSAELEKALQAPTREAIQQNADEATYQRRAMAVEKERAIQENELANQIELARREEALIAQRGQNGRDSATEEAAAARIEAEGIAERERLSNSAKADGIRTIEEARIGSEKARMEIYRDLPQSVMLGLAAREFAGKLERIDHLNLTPELLGPLFTRLMEAGVGRLEDPGSGVTEER